MDKPLRVMCLWRYKLETGVFNPSPKSICSGSGEGCNTPNVNTMNTGLWFLLYYCITSFVVADCSPHVWSAYPGITYYNVHISFFFQKRPNSLFLTAIFRCRPVIMCVIISTNVIIANFIWYFMLTKVCDMTISCCNLKVKWQISKSNKKYQIKILVFSEPFIYYEMYDVFHFMIQNTNIYNHLENAELTACYAWK